MGSEEIPPPSGKHERLNLGCGELLAEDCLNVDSNPLVSPDFIHDLNRLPYPFADGRFSYIRARHILEHLEDPFSVMRELHRLLKPGGELMIKVPHFSRGFTHSQHKAGFDVAFPLYFNRSFTTSGYFGVEFELKEMRLRWMSNVHLLHYIGITSWQIAILSGLDRMLSFLANLNPYICSRFWCYWVGGFDEIEFRFRKPAAP